jgi:hypothetical protein
MISFAELTGLKRRVRDGCTGKRRYLTFYAAEEARLRLLRSRSYRPERGELQAYDCRCGWWHLGHGSDDRWPE